MAKLLSIFLICFSYHVLFFAVSDLGADTISLKSISVEEINGYLMKQSLIIQS